MVNRAALIWAQTERAILRKTVHNGIEYGDMELLCEAYQLMRCAMGMTAEEISDVFDAWGRRRNAGWLSAVNFP